MPYITSAERFGLERGRNEGRNEEKFHTIMELRDFNMKPEEIARITSLTPEKIEAVLAAGDKGLELLMPKDEPRH